jgi:hypothetical protein
MNKRCIAVAAGTAFALLLASCSANDDPSGPIDTGLAGEPTSEMESPVLTPPPVATADPTESDEAEADDETVAVGAAEHTVTSYYALLDDLFADPERSTDELRHVVDKVLLQRSVDSVEEARAAGRVTAGTRTVRDFEVGYIDLEPEQPDTGLTYPIIVLLACLDVSELVSADAPSPEPGSIVADEIFMAYTLHDIGYFDGDLDWRLVVAEPQVTDGDPPEAEPCP